MKLVKVKKTVEAFKHGEYKPKPVVKNECGDKAGYGPNPEHGNNSKANYWNNKV